MNHIKHGFAMSKRYIKMKVNVDKDVSLGLVENHYVNKQVKQMDIQKLEPVIIGVQKNPMMNYKRKIRGSKNTIKENYSDISNVLPQKRTIVDNIYTSMRKQKPPSFNESIPIKINSLPIIPFWKSSFDIMTKNNNKNNINNNNNNMMQIDTNFDRRRSSWFDVKYSLSTDEKDYLTMKKRNA